MAARATVVSSGLVPASFGNATAITSTGQWWTISDNTTDSRHEFFYSNDNGATWTEDTGARTSPDASYLGSGAIFIDADDNIWHTYRSGATAQEIQMGTISGNAITWNANRKQLSVYASSLSCDLIAFPESTGYRVGLMAAAISNRHDLFLHYFDGTSTWSDDQTITNVRLSALTYGYNLFFDHTGDGVTPSATPHIYILIVGSGEATYWKATWSSGDTWALSAAQSLTNASVQGPYYRAGVCNNGTDTYYAFFDSGGDFNMQSRDNANTTTTIHVANFPMTDDPAANTPFMSLAYDKDNLDDLFIGIAESANGGSNEQAWAWYSAQRTQNGTEGGMVLYSWPSLDDNSGNAIDSSRFDWVSNGGWIDTTQGGLYAITKGTASALYGVGSNWPRLGLTNEDWIGPTIQGESIDRDSTGRLWRTAANDGQVWFMYSDDGDEWHVSDTTALTMANGYPCNFFIDADDYLHLVRAASSSAIYYRRGTLSGTTWTWNSSDVTILSNVTSENSTNYGIVAHREGTGWKCHITGNMQVASTSNTIYYARIDITSGQAVTTDVASSSMLSVGTMGTSVSSGSHQHQLDWNHDGGGKVVKSGGDPDLFVALYHWHSSGTDFVWAQRTAYASAAWTLAPSTYSAIGAGMTDLTQFGQLDAVWNGTNFYVAFSKSASPYREVWEVTDMTSIASNQSDLSVAALTGQTAEERPIRLAAGNEGKLFLVGNPDDDSLFYNTYDGSWSGWTDTTRAKSPNNSGYHTMNRHSVGGYTEMVAPKVGFPEVSDYFLLESFASGAGGIGWGIAL